MQFLKMSTIAISLLFFGACYESRMEPDTARSTQAGNAKTTSQAGEFRESEKPNQKLKNEQPSMQPVSLKQADQSQSVTQAVDRKIIKDAELTLEVPAPADAQQRVGSIAENHGGFVVTSESKQRPSSDPSQHLVDVSLVVRVPASQFDAVISQIRALSNVIPESKTTGQDVTEEFIDLEARIKTQKALEAQFLEIMKQAHKVEDALEVQRQIAEVRAEIEKLEGRKRFLENRSSMSTITVHLNSPQGIVVNASGFRKSVKEAVATSIDVAGAIILAFVQFVIVMIPIFVFILLPGGLVVRYFVRRARRIKLARDLTSAAPTPAGST